MGYCTLSDSLCNLDKINLLIIVTPSQTVKGNPNARGHNVIPHCIASIVAKVWGMPFSVNHGSFPAHKQ